MEKQMVRRFLESIFQVYACADGTCSVIVHTLTSTDVNKKQMRLPMRAVPDDLEITGDITVRLYPAVSVTGSYKVLLNDDGRVKIDCWKDFIKEAGWEVNRKIVMLFCRGNGFTWLFANPLHG
nr:uncharacterized protein LOC127318621 [Lolium perenne]